MRASCIKRLQLYELYKVEKPPLCFPPIKIKYKEVPFHLDLDMPVTTTLGERRSC